jgi:hypothetical protein
MAKQDVAFTDLRFTADLNVSPARNASRFVVWADVNGLSRDEVLATLKVPERYLEHLPLFKLAEIYFRVFQSASSDLYGAIISAPSEVGGRTVSIELVNSRGWDDMADAVFNRLPCAWRLPVRRTARRRRRRSPVRHARTGARGDPSEPGPRPGRPLARGRS